MTTDKSLQDYTKTIKSLAEIVKDNNLSEIELKDENGISIKITKAVKEIINMTPVNSVVTNNVQPKLVPEAISSSPAVQDLSNVKGVINSPMVGVLYYSTSPEQPPFVKVGDSVKEGDTLFLIEAMKVFNPIKAKNAGKVVKILVENKQVVEFDQPLVIIE